jgi:hypothetical protein
MGKMNDGLPVISLFVKVSPDVILSFDVTLGEAKWMVVAHLVIIKALVHIYIVRDISSGVSWKGKVKGPTVHDPLPILDSTSSPRAFQRHHLAVSWCSSS